ncbi:MAG TPA: ankyrin repeat domain-containing protein, partial [Candidatus Ozemobacteraceae bacterium]|nr:ankyrin repeat domain-containing protein [Candidatus Ozemobacteraceae bacterium]
MRFLYSALIFLASLASLLGFLLFPPVVVLAMAQRRGTCSRLPVVLGFCIAVVCHCGLEYEANTFFRDDSRPMMALYRWTSLGTWLVRRDDFWYDAAERFACDTPMTFLLTHGASPTEGLRQILRQLSLYGNTHATPFVPPLLSSGADPNVLIFGQSALALTIDRGKFDLATLLLKAGATPSPATDQWGKTLLHRSAAAGAEPEFLLLLADKMGSGSWNLLDARGRAPIHELSTVIQLTLLASMPETLLTTGRDGGTLIHYAIEQGRERLIPRLLELGFTWQTPDS